MTQAAVLVIGAGLREPPEHLLLFEKILNLVHRSMPLTRGSLSTPPPRIPPRLSAAGSRRRVGADSVASRGLPWEGGPEGFDGHTELNSQVAVPLRVDRVFAALT